jgi:glycosyltransferase involved in cell wall biosynthesis
LEKNKLTIVIPTLQRFHFVNRLLKSIEHTDFLETCSQILVVSNLDCPQVKNICYEFLNLGVDYVYTGAIGVNLARNLGLKNADSNFIFFLDDDCILPAEFSFKKVFDAIFQFPEVTAFGGHYLLSDTYSIAGLLYHIKMQSWLLRYANAETDALRLLGGSLLVNKEKLKGLEFNPDNIFGGAETELILRLTEAHHSLKLLDCLNVIHDFNITLFDFLKKTHKQAKFHHRMPQSAFSTFEQNPPYSVIESSLKSNLKLKFSHELIYRLFWLLHKITVHLAKLKLATAIDKFRIFK